MSQVLLEFMEPLIKPRLLLAEEAAKRAGLEQGLQRGIQSTVEVLRDLGHKDIEIRQIIQKKYSLSEKETVEYLQ